MSDLRTCLRSITAIGMRLKRSSRRRCLAIASIINTWVLSNIVVICWGMQEDEGLTQPNPDKPETRCNIAS